jgi:hypothetical protein
MYQNKPSNTKRLFKKHLFSFQIDYNYESTPHLA